MDLKNTQHAPYGYGWLSYNSHTYGSTVEPMIPKVSGPTAILAERIAIIMKVTI